MKFFSTLSIVLLIVLMSAIQINCESLYSIDASFPFNIYEINPASGSVNTVGNLLFTSEAIARHPFSGKIYYTGVEYPYAFAAWNPATGNNELISSGLNIELSPRLCFHPDGRIFATERATNNIYTIDTSGFVSFYGAISGISVRGNSGDIAIDRDGTIFIVEQNKLYEINPVTLSGFRVGLLGANNIHYEGLSFSSDGTCYGITRAQNHNFLSQLHEINTNTATINYVFNTGRYLFDLAGFAASPSIQFSFSSSADTIGSGSNVDYTITLTNSGYGHACLTEVRSILPAHFSFIMGSSSGLTSENPLINENQLIWNGIWLIPSSGSRNLYFSANGGIIRGTFFTSASVSGTNFANPNTGSSIPVYVRVPELCLFKSVNPPEAAPDETLTYSIDYFNAGDDPANCVIILENVPANTQYIPESATGRDMNILFSADNGLSYGNQQDTAITNLQFHRTLPLEPGDQGTVIFQVQIR